MTRLSSGLIFLLASVCVASTVTSQQPASNPGSAAQTALRAADSASTFMVKLNDGSSFMGRVIWIRNDTISFSSRLGVLSLPLTDVRSASPVREKDIRAGEYWFPNPNTTRLMFAPTGRMLDRGKGYFSDYMIFFPGVAVGVTNNFTIGGGMTVFPGVSPAEQLFYLTPKVGLVASEKVNLAVGALAMSIPGSSDGTAGILYTVGTFGDEFASATVGGGLGYTRAGLADAPALMFGGDVRLSPRVAMITENYMFPGEFDGLLASLGMRFLGEKMAFDFGFVMPLGANDTFALPFIGFVTNF